MRVVTGILGAVSLVALVSCSGLMPIEEHEAAVAAKDAEIEDCREENERLVVETAERVSDLESAVAAAETENRLLIEEQNAMREELESLSGEGVSVEGGEGGILVTLQDLILFPSGSASLDASSDELIRRIASVLHDYPDHTIRVTGHTDNVPIRSSNFPSNWELSAARAGAVARSLISKGNLDPTRFVIVGKGEYDPIESNDTEAGRARNRRVEVLIED